MEFHIMAIRKSTGSGIPSGNTAGRPANPGLGQLYSNGEAARLDLYTQASGWQNIVQETPGVSSITGNYSEQTNSGVITISGTNFVSGCYATAIGTNGVQVDAGSTTFNSLVQVTATFTGLSNQYEPYDIKVTNPSNLFGMLPDALYVNASPVWQTSSGSLGTFAEQISMSVSATATDSDSTISYALASGSTLPSGVTLNSASGLISGVLPDISTNTTYNFTINASDGVNTIPRAFSFISNAAPVWVTAAGTLGSFNEQTSITVSAVSATDSDPTITYSLASDSSLPSGLTLNSSTGVISGTLPNVASNTTYTFTINASDGLSLIPRQFSITSLAAPEVFNYVSAATQTWTAPSGVTSVVLKIWGAGGGNAGNYSGGECGYTTGTFTVVPGRNYNIYVGNTGIGRTGGWPGGGTASSGGNGAAAGGGGGYSAVQDSTNNAYLAIAGAGGGAISVANGFKGGGTNGESTGNAGYGVNTGGTQVAGGVANIVIDGGSSNGSSLAGGNSSNPTNGGHAPGGGGGSGYYGGAGGASGGGAVTAGPGGSGYVNPSYSSNGTTIQGYGSDSARGTAGAGGNPGKVVISFA